jgi:hypothetical protein
MSAAGTHRLAELARCLAGTPNRVEIQSRMESPGDLELAWQRAQAVAQVLMEQAELDHSQLQIGVLPAAGAIDTSGTGGPPEKPMVEVILQGEPPAHLAARPTAARSGNAP